MPKKTTAGIDFGLSNIDAVSAHKNKKNYWSRPTLNGATVELVESVLQSGNIDVQNLAYLATTGGRHRNLPEQLGHCPIIKIDEIEAIGRGGQELAGVSPEDDRRIVVVSAGSGTAAIFANQSTYRHAGGTAVGGGTLQGLGKLLLQTTSPLEINELALQGRSNNVDLPLAEVISGPIGKLPPEATAVNFGRIARNGVEASRADLAAALVTMVGQVIALVALNIAKTLSADKTVIVGHLCDLPAICKAIHAVGDLYQVTFDVPERGGYGTALGALLAAGEKTFG